MQKNNENATSSHTSATQNSTNMKLEGTCEIVISRTFSAPASVVYEAWTNPDLVRRWWAPTSLGCFVVSCDADVRVGGSYRYVIRVGDEPTMAFFGTYKEINPPTRLVYSQSFEPMAEAGEVLVTVTFDESAGKTHVVSREVYPSSEVRDAVLASGMEHGMRVTMELLEDLVASLSAAR